MDLTVLDYAILVVTLASLVGGLFFGFSGALSFLAGLLASAFFATFAWGSAASLVPSAPGRAATVGILSLLIFGLVRIVVRKVVRGLVAQPGDALLGAVFSALSGAILSCAGAWALMTFFPQQDGFTSSLLNRFLSFL